MTPPVEQFVFQGKDVAAGPHLLIFGAIHGNEKCGPIAMSKIMEGIASGTLTLQSGSVTFVPISNPRAYQENKRFVEDNLNRIFRKTEAPETYEAHLANELCLLADTADVILDIHSSNADALPNVFVDYPTPQNLALASVLGADFAVLDWPKVYEGNEHGFESHTTDQYAHEQGKIGVLMECGQHDDPLSVDVAEQAILNALAHLGITEKSTAETDTDKEFQSVYMKKVFAMEQEGDHFLDAWSHLQRIPPGTCVAERKNGEQICVDRESYVIFPKTYATPGSEWFYLGTPER